MSLAETRGHPATADKPASREIKIPLADAATVVVAVTPNAAAAVTKAAVGMAEAAGIEAAGKKVDEEFQWRRMK